jgi:hypothetical protein
MPSTPRNSRSPARGARAARIEQLRSMIASNSYVVNLEELALRIVEDGVLTQ